ncbi:IS5 family transposase [Acetobacter fallax]|uniref:IS5 family transposase n=1 Tax=Acetobacter fallax TaxID=1737473 RepID=UPI0038CFFA75
MEPPGCLRPDLRRPDRTGWPFETPDDRRDTSQSTPNGSLPAQKGAFPRHTGRTKGGLNSKLHAMCDGQGRPVRLPLTAGQVSDFKGADVLLADLPDETEEVIGDRGYDSNKIRQSLADRNIAACIPPKKNRTSKPPYDWHLCKKRRLIENMFAKLKIWRRVATRYDRCAHTFMSAIHIAATFIFWLKE